MLFEWGKLKEPQTAFHDTGLIWADACVRPSLAWDQILVSGSLVSPPVVVREERLEEDDL